MTAVVYPIVIEQGATFELHLIWKINSTTPRDLTGYTAAMQVRHKFSSATVLLSFATGGSGITLGGALGTIDIVKSATLTDVLTMKTAVYDLELTAPDGTVTRLVEGPATITPEVTR